MPLIVKVLTSRDHSGVIFVEISAFVGKYPKSLTLFNTILIVKITGNLMKGRLCLVELHVSFTTLILCSVFGMFSLALVKLTIVPINISAISSHTEANSPSA